MLLVCKISRKVLMLTVWKWMKKRQMLKVSLGCFRNKSGDEEHLIKLPPCFFQPPFVMEKWIVGIEEHQSVECVVTYEVSSKKQIKKLFT